MRKICVTDHLSAGYATEFTPVAQTLYEYLLSAKRARRFMGARKSKCVLDFHTYGYTQTK